MDHQTTCDGCGDLFPQDQTTFTGAPRLVNLCDECFAEYEEYERAKAEFDAQCDEQE